MDKDSALTRLTQSIEYLNSKGKAITDAEIAALSGLNRPHVTAMRNGDPKRVTEGNFRKFATAYSDYISGKWLLTGEGQMVVPDKSMRPHVEAKAAAGFMAGIGVPDTGQDLRPSIQFLPDYDFTIEADGESMWPKIDSGDILACRVADDRANPPIGKICVIDTKDGAAVKVLKAVGDDELILHSLNPKFEDFQIIATDINRIAVVVGIISPIG